MSVGSCAGASFPVLPGDASGSCCTSPSEATLPRSRLIAVPLGIHLYPRHCACLCIAPAGCGSAAWADDSCIWRRRGVIRVRAGGVRPGGPAAQLGFTCAAAAIARQGEPALGCDSSRAAAAVAGTVLGRPPMVPPCTATHMPRQSSSEFILLSCFRHHQLFSTSSFRSQIQELITKNFSLDCGTSVVQHGPRLHAMRYSKLLSRNVSASGRQVHSASICRRVRKPGVGPLK